MSAEINWKNKYFTLRTKYMEDLKMAFRQGMEQGAQQAQMQQAQEQQAQQQALDEAAMGQQPGQPGQEGEDASQQDPGFQDSANPQGSELDQHIQKLESMLGNAGSSMAKAESDNLRSTIEALKAMRKTQKESYDLKKSEYAIKGIAKALHKPAHKHGVQATANLTSNAKQALSMQHKIVQEMMKSWGEEEKRAATGIKGILNVEGLTKKE